MAHLEAFAQGLPDLREVCIVSRGAAGALALGMRAQALGLHARILHDANAALADCPLVVTCTPARFATLAQVLAAPPQAARGPVLFKSCGWAGWDLAAARTAMGTAP